LPTQVPLEAVGTHTLQVTVSCVDPRVGPQTHTFRKNYRFNVMKPLAITIRTAEKAPATEGRRLQYVQVGVRNLTHGLITIASMDFIPNPERNLQVLHRPMLQPGHFGNGAEEAVGEGRLGSFVDALDAELLVGPNDVYTNVYEIHNTNGVLQAATSEELALTSLVGHVKIRWRNDMGEEGIVASSDITEEHHEQRVVAVQAELPGRWAVHQPFQGKIRVTNNLNRALELQLQLRKAHADGLLALGKSFRNIGTVSPGQTVETTMDFMPVSLGLRRVEGIVLVDMVTAMEYPQGTLGTVLICARPEQPEDGASPP